MWKELVKINGLSQFRSQNFGLHLTWSDSLEKEEMARKLPNSK